MSKDNVLAKLVETAKIVLKLTLEGLRCPQWVRVKDRRCRTMYGTTVQAIRPGWQGGSRKVKIWSNPTTLLKQNLCSFWGKLASRPMCTWLKHQWKRPLYYLFISTESALRSPLTYVDKSFSFKISTKFQSQSLDQHDHHDHHDYHDHHEEVGGCTQGSWRLSL